jgi:hypothetical protein
MRKLKWRLVGTANVVYGGISQSNIDINAPQTPDNEDTLSFGIFDHRPYVELGYGVENILQFLRIDFFHRLTYLDNPDARNFGILIGFQFNL